MASKSLAEQLADITNPLPTLCDPEDDIYEETRARVAERDPDLSEEEEGGAPSQLRQRAAGLLSDHDPRYAGRAVSRQSMMADSDDDDDDDLGAEEEDDDAAGDSDQGSAEDDGDEEEEEEEQVEAFKAKLNGFAANTNGFSPSDEADTDSEEAVTTPLEHSAAESASGDEAEDDDADDNTDGGAADDDDDEAMSEQEDSAGVHLTSQSAGSDAEKGAAVQAQLGVWDQLLECRIKLQPCLQLSNQLPPAHRWQPFWAAADQATTGQLLAAAAAADQLSRQLLQLQAALLARFPETSQLSGGPPPVAAAAEDASDGDDDDGDSDGSEGARQPAAPASRKRRQQNSLAPPEQAAKRFSAYRPYRDATIQRWNDKTRLTAGKLSGGRGASFAAFEQQSTLKQVEQILSDRDRLVRRTQLRRCDAAPLGRPAPETEPDGVTDGQTEPQTATASGVDKKDYDEEIFDDTDFYHQLLRKLIERKTVDVTDPLALGKQWIQIQKLRSKMKKRVDTRASKGRKVRYEVYPKLVNFMASRRPPGAMSDTARDELFSSLFGQRHTQARMTETTAESA